MTSIDIQGVVDKLEPGKEKYAKALKAAGESFLESYKIFNDPDYESRKGWKVEIDTPEVRIHSKQFPFGNVFALCALAPIKADLAFRESFDHFENIPNWNSNMCYSKIVTTLTDHTDIVHYANPSIMTVKSRDYVVARIWRKIGDEIYAGGKSVELDEIPETKDRVRGKLHIGCGKFTPDKCDPNKTHLEYILSIDLKGLIPKTIVNSAMGKMMVKDYEETTKRYNEIMANQS
jgi:steroidogenic acute regulatory protein|uniref:START domain-containing protein n=1 Tax=Panagrolaimus sp. PS1159 TaxID=55785 RepID=A0AC35G7C5_9BILA